MGLVSSGRMLAISMFPPDLRRWCGGRLLVAVASAARKVQADFFQVLVLIEQNRRAPCREGGGLRCRQ